MMASVNELQSDNSGPCQATRQDIARHAREHYEQVSTEAMCWCSTIPKAIDAWEREQGLLDNIYRLAAEGMILMAEIEHLKGNLDDDPQDAHLD